MSAPVADTVVPAERRRYPRKNVIDSQLLTVALPGEDAAHRRGIVLDVSEGGMAVQPFVPLTPGSTSGIELDLAGSTLFRGTGIVAWVGPSGRAGIRFVDVPPAAHEQLRRFLGVDSPKVEEPELAERAPEQVVPAAAPAAAPIADTEIVESQELDLDGALGLIAERARDITSATGVAVALGDSQSMVCRASSGMAPDLGVRLQRDAGLSGYCLRTGEMIHCPDTLEDPRINPAVAEQLNVRSILIVPVFTGEVIAGLLEVLSARPHAFEPRHIVRLQRVAQLLSSAIEDNAQAEQIPEPDDRSDEVETVAPGEDYIVAIPEPQPVPVAMDVPVNAADVAAPALSIPSEPEAPEPEVTVPAPVQSSDEPALLIADIPTAEDSLEEPAQEILATEVSEIPQVQPEPAAEQRVVELRPEASAPAVIAASAPKPELASVPAPQSQELHEAPAEVTAPKAQVLELAPVLVRRVPKHSRARGSNTLGVKSGRVHHIGPVYLTSALGLGGEVVLGATITTQGTLDNVRVVRGSKLLGSAAISTVSQWRCQPCQFNGGPVEVDTTITIHFAPAK
jgi:TonB family protein